MDGLTKTCRRCEVAKAVEDFRKWKRVCKPCERAEKNAARAGLDRAPIVGVLKTCSKCGEEKLCENFSFDRRASDGRHGWCRPCATQATVRRYNTDPEKYRERSREFKRKDPERTRLEFRKYDFGRRFGLTPDEYDEHRASVQNCGICGTTEPGHKGWVLDHCHTTERLREFLCGTCNLVLGQFNDDPDRFISAAAYLLKHAQIHEEIALENSADI